MSVVDFSNLDSLNCGVFEQRRLKTCGSYESMVMPHEEVHCAWQRLIANAGLDPSRARGR